MTFEQVFLFVQELEFLRYTCVDYAVDDVPAEVSGRALRYRVRHSVACCHFRSVLTVGIDCQICEIRGIVVDDSGDAAHVFQADLSGIDVLDDLQVRHFADQVEVIGLGTDEVAH